MCYKEKIPVFLYIGYRTVGFFLKVLKASYLPFIISVSSVVSFVTFQFSVLAHCLPVCCIYLLKVAVGIIMCKRKGTHRGLDLQSASHVNDIHFSSSETYVYILIANS